MALLFELHLTLSCQYDIKADYRQRFSHVKIAWRMIINLLAGRRKGVSVICHAILKWEKRRLYIALIKKLSKISDNVRVTFLMHFSMFLFYELLRLYELFGITAIEMLLVVSNLVYYNKEA